MASSCAAAADTRQIEAMGAMPLTNAPAWCRAMSSTYALAAAVPGKARKRNVWVHKLPDWGSKAAGTLEWYAHQAPATPAALHPRSPRPARPGMPNRRRWRNCRLMPPQGTRLSTSLSCPLRRESGHSKLDVSYEQAATLTSLPCTRIHLANMHRPRQPAAATPTPTARGTCLLSAARSTRCGR